MKLKALIVDDEQMVRENMLSLLDEYCPSIEVVGTADTANTALQLFTERNANVIFLDINMPGNDGFSVLRSIEGRAMVVFVTAYQQHAIRAIREGAFDYILKPVDVDDLMGCEQRLLKRAAVMSDETRSPDKALVQLAETLNKIRQQNKISIHHTRGIKLVNIDEIIRLSADDNYTTVHLHDERIVVARPLKVFLQTLDNHKFFRVHRSHAINADHMLEYIRDSMSGYVIMRDKEKIEISRRRSAEFIQWLTTSFRDIKAN
jgi:two-component system, LytTR family, response regulator